MPKGENTTVEQLQSEVSDLEKLLNELKTKTFSDAEREKKEKDVKSKAEKLKGQIDELSKQEGIDPKLAEETEKAKVLLESYEKTLGLKSSIKDNPSEGSKSDSKENSDSPSSTEKTQASPQTETENPAVVGEEKGFFGKAGDWLGEQWDDVTSGEKRKEEPGKNILRVAGVGLTGYALYRGVKSLRNRATGKKKEKEGGDDKDKSKENDNKEKEDKNNKDDKETSWWKKFLVGGTLAAGTVIGGVEIYKNRNRISSWVKEKLGKALNFDEAMYSVEAEVRNGINSDNNFGEFSAHFDGMSYDENTHEISSFGQKTKINKSNKTIDGEPMDKVQFASWEELFHAVNIVNFAKRELKGRGANETPFSVNKTTGDIDFSISDAGKTQFIGANGSNFWTTVLGLGGTAGGGLLGGYFLGLKGGLVGATAGGLAGYTLGSVIDNTSTMGRACGTIAKGANLEKFKNYLNSQNIWGEQKEEYKPDDETPIHKYLNKVKQEIDDAYGDGTEDSARRDLEIERNESKPDTYKIKSYYQEITLKLDGCTAKKGEDIDFSKINNIRIEKYDTISGKKIGSRGDGLDIKFPSTEKGIEEAIRTANLTNKIVNDWRGKGGESYPFFRGKYSTPPCLDMDTDGFRGKTILSRDGAKLTPTLFEDLKKGSNGGIGSTVGYTKSHQTKMHDQARQDKDEGSQYIKFLHQIGEGKFWKKV